MSGKSTLNQRAMNMRMPTPQVSLPQSPPAQPHRDILRRSTTLPSAGTQSHSFVRKRLRRTRLVHNPTPVPLSTIQGEEPDENIHFDVEKALNTAYLPDDSVVTEFESFDYDSLSPYFVSISDEKKKVKSELERYAAIVENPSEPMIFAGGSRLGKGNENGQKALAILIAKIFKAFTICKVDNDSISLIYAPIAITPQSVRALVDQLDRDDRASSKQENRDQAAREIWQTDEQLFEDTAILFEFITGSLARLISQIARGESWRLNLLGALAKFSTKVKFLVGNLPQHSPVAVRNGDMAIATFEETYKETLGEKRNEDPNPDTLFREFARNLDANSRSSDHLKVSEYYVNQQKVRHGFISLLEYILEALLPGTRHSGFSANEYEICGVVTETGFHDFKTCLFQDRDFEFASTSDLDQLNFAHPAFRMLNASIGHFKERAKHSRLAGQRMSNFISEPKTHVEWMYSDTTEFEDNSAEEVSSPEPAKYTQELQTMNDIITIMVLVALANPVVSGRFKWFLNMFYLTADVGDNIRPFPERPFKAFIRLYTNEFEEARKERLPDDVLQLSQAVEAGLFSRTSLLDEGISNNNSRKRTLKLIETNELMDSWVYSESAIVVKCGLYVWLVALGACVLVTGGLAIGMTLEERIPGVDPFNITVYAWALAAFIVLICKAIMVEEWTWNDFLHRCVKCRSVAEVRAVTGIHDQLIIAKLLHDEQESLLKTSGPYNAMFLRKAEDGISGFSIDVPVTTKTLLLSGLSMLKVETPLGHALVCLDSRRGTELSVVQHRQVSEDKELMICGNIDRIIRAASKIGQQPRLPMKTAKLEWRKVEGVYNALEAVFI